MLSKINWYFYRLSAMSPAEIFYRSSQWLNILDERRHSLPNDKFISDGTESSKAWLEFRRVKGVQFWKEESHSDQVSNVCRYFPDGYKTTLENSEFLLKHRLEIFNKMIDYGDLINWHQDPLTRREWPLKFWADIDFRNADAVGGVKWVWEINRHHHLVTMAKAFFLTNDERFANETIAQISDWIDKNPPLLGINWTSSLELAIRLINWVWVLYFISDSKSLTKAVFQKIQLSINLQAVYISRHLSAYSSANNHRVGEAAGLAIVGMVFPWLTNAESWKQTGMKILNQEITNLILADGGSAEQAPHYLVFIWDFYFIVMRLAEINQVKLGPCWNEHLHSAAQFLQCLLNKQGQIPFIGDNDDAWVVRLDDCHEANNYRSIITSAAVWFNDPTLKGTDLIFDEKSWWLLGEGGKKAFDDLNSNNQEPISKSFLEGGYCVFQDHKIKLVFDCGPLGYGSMAAHGHADALSVCLNMDGEEILVDSGTFAYQEGKSWREFFRGTSAHNTIRIDGNNQSQILGPFLWGKKAKVKLINWQSVPDYDVAVAEHDGYNDWGVIHRRSVMWLKPDIIFIRDELFGNGIHKFEQFWHFMPASETSIRDNGFQTKVNHKNYIFENKTSNQTNSKMVIGTENPIQGWISKHYGEKKPAPVIIISGYGTFPITMDTLIYSESIPSDLVSTKKDFIYSVLGGTI